MYRNEREQEILHLLDTQNYMTVKQLSTLLYISESSIRRNLSSLEKQGLVTRSYGGVTSAKNNPHMIPFSTRVHHNITAKKIMARKAGDLIPDGSIVFLDQSSSAFFVAQEILEKSNVTVVTNNIEIIEFFSQSEVEVISSGGRLSKSNRNCLLGDDAHNIFTQIHADLLFFSAKSLAANGGIYDCFREEVCIRNTMLANAEKKIFLCDSEKIGRYAGYLQCSVRDIDCLITEDPQCEKLDLIEGARKITQ